MVQAVMLMGSRLPIIKAIPYLLVLHTCTSCSSSISVSFPNCCMSSSRVEGTPIQTTTLISWLINAQSKGFCGYHNLNFSRSPTSKKLVFVMTWKPPPIETTSNRTVLFRKSNGQWCHIFYKVHIMIQNLAEKKKEILFWIYGST